MIKIIYVYFTTLVKKYKYYPLNKLDLVKGSFITNNFFFILLKIEIRLLNAV